MAIGRKENHERRNQQALKEQSEFGPIARMSLEDGEMEDEEYESDFEESGSDVSDEEDF